jgi:outer membrane lipoprotein SlyB
MTTLRRTSLLLLFTLTPCACVATTTTSTVWPAPEAAYARPGHVQSIHEVVERQDGNPAGGALAGALIGGLLGGRGPGALVGAIGGAAIGAAASQGSRVSRHYEVFVQYDDGGYQTFVYGDYSPFAPGQPVVLMPGGLASQ